MRPFILSTVSSFAFFAAGAALACESAAMATTDAGFVRKIVAGSNQIEAFTDETAATTAYTMELLRPYFVICETPDFYRITDANALTVDEALAGNTGFVRRDQVFEWTTREALSFSDIAFVSGRPEVVAWDSEKELNDFMKTANEKLHPPTFRENIDATLRRERATRPYPVLGSQQGMIRETTPKRYYNVLLPTALRPTDVIVIEKGSEDLAQAVLTSATIVLVFDATGSMENFTEATAKAITAGLASLPADVREKSSIGFIFYRDAGDPEALVEIPPIPLAEGVAVLKDLVGKVGGGGDDAEPVLDALYYAANIYDWGQSGKKIVVAVLNEDAKPATIGDPEFDARIPAGLDAFAIARNLFEQGIPVITVQAGPGEGPNLAPVLQTLADETTSKFLPWGDAGLNEGDVAGAMVTLMNATGVTAIKEGETIADMAFDLNGFDAIPLEVLDGEKLERMRAAGVNFNIELGEGGVLVQSGYLLESPDLLAPLFEIDKDTLQKLINLYSVLSVGGADADGLREAASQAIAAIAGEDFDPEDTIQEIIEKKLGIQFRSELLNFDLAYIEGMTPNERLALTKRIQDAGGALTTYLDANLEEFDTLPAVWMPIAALP